MAKLINALSGAEIEMEAFLATIEENNQIADHSDLFNQSSNGSGMSEQSFSLGTNGELEICEEDLIKLTERARDYTARLVESGARKASTALKEQFTNFVCQLMASKNSGKKMAYQHADRYLRLAFLSLGFIPSNQLEEVLNWANSKEGAIPLKEAVMMADHGFTTEESVVVFDKAFFKTLRQSLVAEANRFIDAIRRGPVRVQARANAGDKYAGYQVSRFMGQACRQFGVNAQTMQSDERVAAFISREAEITLKGIIALGGLRKLNRGLMTMGENLQKWGMNTRFESIFDASLDAIRGKTGWSPVEILVRFDFASEIERSQPKQRALRKALATAKRELAKNNKEVKTQSLSQEAYSFLADAKRFVNQAKFLAKKGDKAGASEARRNAAGMKAMALAPKQGADVYAELQKATSSFEDVVFQESVSWEPKDGSSPKVAPLDKGLMEVRVPFRTSTGLLTAVFYAAVEDLWEVSSCSLATVDTLPDHLVDTMIGGKMLLPHDFVAA